MPSKLKSDTARLNGAKSRGPTTPAGLEKSSQNAVTHGLTSQSAIVLACESQEEFDKILNNFLITYKPAGPAEKDLVEEMVACRWRIRRLWGIETSLLDAEYLNQKFQSPTGGPRLNLANAFRALADDSRSLALAHRYETRLHRTYNHAYATLRELQQARDPLPPAGQPLTPGVRDPEPSEPEPRQSGLPEPDVPSDRPTSDSEPPTSTTRPYLIRSRARRQAVPATKEASQNEPSGPEKFSAGAGPNL